MKSEQFVIEKNNIPVGCELAAVLYTKDDTRAFAIYTEDIINKSKYKVAELKLEDDEVYFEDLTNDEEIKEVWNQYKELCNKINIGD